MTCFGVSMEQVMKKIKSDIFKDLIIYMTLGIPCDYAIQNHISSIIKPPVSIVNRIAGAVRVNRDMAKW